EPPFHEFWAYRGKVVQRETKVFAQTDSAEAILLVKHCVLAEDAAMEKVRREVQAFENYERRPNARREGIPEELRRLEYVRDGGKCVECGSSENLEYDHTLPVSKGGAKSEGNLRLLCLICNRRKGSAI